MGGHRVPSANGKTYPVTGPATGAVERRASASRDADVHRAVNLARDALAGPWPALDPADRAGVLRRIADGIGSRAAAIAGLESLGTGVPAAQARELADRAADCFRSCADLIAAARREEPRDGVRRGPGGIAGLVPSWQAPFLSSARQLGPALAAGCPVILVSDEWTPLSASAWPEILAEAGVPGEAFSLLHGRRADGAAPALLAHPLVHRAAVAGDSAAVRDAVRAAGPVTRIRAETASATPCVIFAGADIARAADAVLASAFALNGTAPGAGSRILAERPVYEEVVERLAAGVSALRTGAPDDPETDVGPVTHADLRDRLVAEVRVAVREEARLVAGGSVPGGLPDGNYLAPTVLADVTMAMPVFAGGAPGPVACVSVFSADAEAAAAAGALPGRAAAVWTPDPDRAERFAAALTTDDTWVNAAPSDPPAAGAVAFFTRTRTLHAVPQKPNPDRT